MAAVELQVNGSAVKLESWDPDQPLLYLLRNRLGLYGAKYGCGLGQCGACAVLIDGKPARACTVPLSEAAGHAVTTIEGLGSAGKPHPVQAAFIAEQAAQCGYCTNGMVIATAALLERNPKPTLDQAKEALGDYLCRCGTHVRILRAVMRAAGA
ncbi:MAG TPA: (2Fe-2S)-binding protein [Alphaproteobacteria bacterium]|nr:(2Fe-2S)-binding protein [Alphaproteobacteria bacterium]